MSRFPEHDKLAAVKDASQTIGEFLDFGLSRQGLTLYERLTYDCECSACRARDAAEGASLHAAAEKATIVNGRVQVTDWQPTSRTIQAILAEHFEIDQAKLDAEKQQMLDELSAGAGPR